MSKRIFSTCILIICLITYVKSQATIDSAYINKRVHDTSFSHHTQYFTITQKQFEKLHLNFCDTFSLVFDGFYPLTDTVSIVRWTFLKPFLISEGFTMTNIGYGNWQDGPEFIKEDFKKDSCHCEVDKIYFNYHMQKDSTYIMKVKEKIICNEKEPTWIGEGK